MAAFHDVPAGHWQLVPTITMPPGQTFSSIQVLPFHVWPEGHMQVLPTRICPPVQLGIGSAQTPFCNT